MVQEEPRSDEQWLSELREAPARAETVVALRSYVVGGLRRALAGRPGVSDADLEDFAQASVIRILDRLESFEGRSRFTTWALAIAIRVAMTELRRRRWGDRSLADLEVDRPSPRSTRAESDPGDALVRADEIARLERAIETHLTPRQRTAILAELAGMPTAVLAEQLGITPNALYKLHHDARRKLRAALEQDQARSAPPPSNAARTKR